MHLVEEPSAVDPTYIEDFLLTYRTFLTDPMEVGKKLLEWFHVDGLRDTVRGGGASGCTRRARALSPCTSMVIGRAGRRSFRLLSFSWTRGHAPVGHAPFGHASTQN